jgi:cytochrome c-type biogenesis protein
VLSLAFLAGVLAAFNPCGFVLLPAYLTSIILGEEIPGNRWADDFRAVKFSAGMTLGFIGVFGSFALLLTSISTSIERYLPFFTLLVGFFLIIISVFLVMGKSLILRKLANPNIAPTRGWLSQIGYGVSFALASLSCTVGPFLTITAAAISKRDALSTFALFTTYAIGMGSVVLLLGLLVVTARLELITKLKRSQGKISTFSGYFLLVVGFYEGWYGWYEIRILHGNNSSDPIVSFVTILQSKVTQWLANLGFVTIFLGILSLSMVLLITNFRKQKLKSLKESVSD